MNANYISPARHLAWGALAEAAAGLLVMACLMLLAGAVGIGEFGGYLEVAIFLAGCGVAGGIGIRFMGRRG